MEGGGEERSATPQHVKADTPVFSPGCVGRAREEGGGRVRGVAQARSLCFVIMKKTEEAKENKLLLLLHFNFGFALWLCCRGGRRRAEDAADRRHGENIHRV